MNNRKKMKFIVFCGLIILIIAVLILVIFSNNGKNYFVGLSYEELNKKIENKDDFVLCVSSTTCSHCAEYKPKLKEIANKYKVEIYYTDVDLYSKEDNKSFSDSYKITGTPTTLIFIDGKEVSVMSRIEGDVSKDKVISTLNKYDFIKK